MILSAEERAEWEQMLQAAWSKSSSVAFVAADLQAMLDDAEQAQKGWAKIILTDALDAGLQKLAKKYRTEQAKTIKGPVATTIGVMGKAGKFEQLSIFNVTPQQLREKIKERETRLRSESRNAAALRRILAVCDKHPKCKTVGGALKAEGITLDAVLAGAA